MKKTLPATRARRERALAELQQIADDGGFDFDKLDDQRHGQVTRGLMFEMRLNAPTHPAGEFDSTAVVAAEYTTEIIGLCGLLGETDADSTSPDSVRPAGPLTSPTTFPRSWRSFPD